MPICLSIIQLAVRTVGTEGTEAYCVYWIENHNTQTGFAVMFVRNKET